MSYLNEFSKSHCIDEKMMPPVWSSGPAPSPRPQDQGPGRKSSWGPRGRARPFAGSSPSLTASPALAPAPASICYREVLGVSASPHSWEVGRKREAKGRAQQSRGA